MIHTDPHATPYSFACSDLIAFHRDNARVKQAVFDVVGMFESDHGLPQCSESCV